MTTNSLVCSINSSVTFSTKDCRRCNTRRIRCDRKLPSCFKCSKKGLSCPGYSRPLRWTNSIAIRGRFRGLGSPDASQASDRQNLGIIVSETPANFGLENQQTESPVTSITKLFAEPVLSRLMYHYATTIAPMMVWLDSEKNEYRRLIMPLAATQPVLKLAILVISAAHAPSESGVDEDLIKSACQTAIKMITERVRLLTDQSAGDDMPLDGDVEDIEAILAAALVLSNHSLLKSYLSLAQFHRQAVRVLIKTLMFTRTSRNEIFVFLKNQAAGYDVLACTTLFHVDHIQHAVLPEADRSLFGNFLRIIHAITIWPLQQVSEDSSFRFTSVMELENHFELARGSTLLLAGSLLESRTEIFKHDFIQLVTLYHHAGILYAYKRLDIFTFDENARYHSTKLFEALDRIKDIPIFLVNLPWPVFIAGICSWDNAERRSKISNLCQILSANTRFEHYNIIEIFLRELWESPHHDWALLARERERRGEPIVAV